MEAVRALREAGGVARYRELRLAGVSRRSVAEAMDAGLVVRPHRGCYALVSTPWPEVVATVFRGVPCCVTVLVAAGLPVVPSPTKPHVCIPPNRSLGRPGIRDLDLAVIHHADLGRTKRRELAVALDMAWACIGRNGQLAAIDAALRLRLMHRDEVLDFVATPAAVKEWLFTHADPLSESPMESFARAAMIDAGISFELQVQISGVGRVDFLVEGTCVVECDGFSYHSDPDAFERDRLRGNALTTQRIPYLRYAYNQVMRTPEQMIADIRALLWHAAA